MINLFNVIKSENREKMERERKERLSRPLFDASPNKEKDVDFNVEKLNENDKIMNLGSVCNTRAVCQKCTKNKTNNNF